MEEYMLPCLTKRFFGVECLGCGIQRSLVFLVQGDFKEAFFIYPAIYPMILLGGFIVGNMFFPQKHITKITWILGILTALMMIGNYVWKHFI